MELMPVLPSLLIDAKAVPNANSLLLLPTGDFQDLINSLLEGNCAKASLPESSPFLPKKEPTEREPAEKEPADILSSAAVNTAQPILDLLPLQPAILINDERIDPPLVSKASATLDWPRLSLSSPVIEPPPAPIPPSVNADAIALMVEVGKEQGILAGPQPASQNKAWIDPPQVSPNDFKEKGDEASQDRVGIDPPQEKGSIPYRPKIFSLGERSLLSQETNGDPVRNSSEALNPTGIVIKLNPAAEQRAINSDGVNLQGKIRLNDEAREPLTIPSNQPDHFLFSNHRKDSPPSSSPSPEVLARPQPASQEKVWIDPPQVSPNDFKQKGEEASQDKVWIDLQQEERSIPNGPKIISLVDRSIPGQDLKVNLQEKNPLNDESREPLATFSNQSDNFLFSDREKDGMVGFKQESKEKMPVKDGGIESLSQAELDRSSRFSTKSEGSPAAEIETKSPSSFESRKEPSDIYRQIGKELLQSLRYHEEKVRLTLDPPQLGHLNIEIKRDHENIRATLWTDNPVTKEILEAQQSDLYRMLREDGFKLERFDVFFQQGGTFQERQEGPMTRRQETSGTYQEQKEVSSDLTALSPVGSRYVDRFI